MKIKNNLDKILMVFFLVVFAFIGFRNKSKLENVDNEHLVLQSQEESIDETKEEVNESPSFVYVDVSGCVMNPGLYKLEESARVKDAIDMAGGFCEEVDVENINLSKKVYDEMKLHVYKKDENPNLYEVDPNHGQIVGAKVNINQASLEQLMTLPGIGEVKAKEIIAYREKNKFSSIEEIKNISGIGDKTFEKLKDLISIN